VVIWKLRNLNIYTVTWPGDLFVLFCRGLNNGNEYNITVTEGFVFKYLEINKQENNNPFKFNIKKI